MSDARTEYASTEYASIEYASTAHIALNNSPESTNTAYGSRQECGLAIRPATIDDLDGIMEVEHVAFPPVMRYSAAKIGSRLRREYDGISFRRDYFVATQDTRIVGYGEVAIQSPSVALFGATATVAKEIGALDDRVGALISLGVHPDHAGRGIGRSLVLRRLEHLTAYNIRQVFTHAWSAGGFPHLARSTGFTLIKGWNGAMHPDGTTPTLYYRDLAANPLGNTAQQSRRMGLHKATNGRKTDIASNDDEQ